MTIIQTSPGVYGPDEDEIANFWKTMAIIHGHIVAQLNDALLAEVLNWEDALGVSYRLSPHYANYTEIEHLATAIWRRAQERHQLDKDERS